MLLLMLSFACDLAPKTCNLMYAPDMVSITLEGASPAPDVDTVYAFEGDRAVTLERAHRLDEELGHLEHLVARVLEDAPRHREDQLQFVGREGDRRRGEGATGNDQDPGKIHELHEAAAQQDGGHDEAHPDDDAEN